MRKILLLLLILSCCVGCSSDEPTQVSNDYAQQLYNSIKGTYIGNVMIDNIPQEVHVIIGNDFTVRRLPLKPVLSRIFTNEAELNEAIRSARDVVFTAQTDNMTVSGTNVLLTMKPSDLLFPVTVGDKKFQIAVRFSTSSYINSATSELSLNMNVTELFCDSHSYEVTTNQINYYVDIAQKQENN